MFRGCTQDLLRLLESRTQLNIRKLLKCCLLNRANKVLGITTISEGGLSGTVTDVRLIYQYAIKGNASGIIVSLITTLQEIPTQVRAIRKITQKIKEAGNLLDIQLLDHIIITPEMDLYRSFADEGQTIEINTLRGIFFGLTSWIKTASSAARTVFRQTQKIKNVCLKRRFQFVGRMYKLKTPSLLPGKSSPIFTLRCVALLYASKRLTLSSSARINLAG